MMQRPLTGLDVFKETRKGHTQRNMQQLHATCYKIYGTRVYAACGTRHISPISFPFTFPFPKPITIPVPISSFPSRSRSRNTCGPHLQRVGRRSMRMNSMTSSKFLSVYLIIFKDPKAFGFCRCFMSLSCCAALYPASN